MEKFYIKPVFIWQVGVASREHLPASESGDRLHAPRIYARHIQNETKMATDRPRRQIEQRLATLRPVEFHILISLAAGERHGYGIIRDIETRGDDGVPDVGTMYRALARMVESGLIEAAARRSAPDAGDERRNYYRITDAGLQVARAEARRLEALMRAVRTGGLLTRGTK